MHKFATTEIIMIKIKMDIAIKRQYIWYTFFKISTRGHKEEENLRVSVINVSRGDFAIGLIHKLYYYYFKSTNIIFYE